jgi:tetratricopeptide (TPR) repeat protein
MSNRKIVIVVVSIFLVVLGPTLLLSNFGLGLIQGIVDKNPKGSAAPWTQYNLGQIYYYTLRPEKAVEAFEIYNERYTENKDQRYWDAMYFRALALDDAGKAYKAANLFQDYYYTCPREDPNRPEVKKECLRMRHHIPMFTPDD